MAGFLRKKVKDKPVPSSPIPLGAAPQPPPLFARFATSNKSDNSPAPRVVSSPKVLSGNVRKDQPQRRQPTPTGGAKKRSSQNQVPSKPPASVPRPLTPPLVVNNKPLPPPSPPASAAAADPSGSTPTQSFIPSNNNKQTRPPPSVFNKNQPPLNVHVVSNSFSSAQTSNSSPASRRPSTSNNNNSFTSPSKRNNSNTNLPPQILPPIANRTSKMTQQNLPTPPAFGRQNFTPTTAQTQMLHLSQPSSLANQDLQHPATNTVNNVNSSMSMIGASPTQISNMQQQQSEVSDRGGLVDMDMDMDLPPEFAALFHNFNQQFNLEEEDRNSVHHSINSNNNDEQQHVPASNVPRSLDRPLINPDQQLPPLPPPKSTATAAESDMGVASSTPHVIGNGYGLASSTKDFYSPRVNGRTSSSSSSYNNNSAAAAANQPQMTLNRRHSPPPPPLPSVTASPPLPVKSLFRNEVSSSSNNRTVTHNRPAADPNYLQNPSRSPSSPRKKSVVVHSSSPPVAGKPRIFAMTAQVDDEETTVSSSFSVGPPPPPYVQYGGAAKKQQQQQSTTTRTNGNDSYKPVSVVQPSTPPLKSALNHRVEQQQQLPPTPPFSHKRGVSRLSRKKDDEDNGRPHTLVNGSSRNRKKDESKSKSKSDEDEEPRSQLQNGLLQPHTSGSRSRKDLISILDEEPPRPVSQHIPPPPPPSPGSRRSSSRKELKLDEQQRPRTPSRTRKSRPAEVVSQYSSNNHNSDDVVLPGTPDSHQRSMSSLRTLMTKSHPSTPAAAAAAHKPLIFDASPKVVAPLEPAIQLDEDEEEDDDDYEDTKSKVGIILDDDDPFARVEGVMMLTPPLSSVGGKEEEDGESVGGGGSNEKMKLEPMKYPSISSLNSCCSHVGSEKLLPVSPPPVIDGVVVAAPPTPVSPEEPRKTTTTTTTTSTTTTTKKKKKKKRRDEDSRTESTTFEPMLDNNSEFVAVTTTTTITTSSAVDDDPEIESEPEPILPAYTIIDFLSDPQLLSSLLTFFTFYDWCLLSSLSKEIRILLVQSPVLRETILERYLKTVGYSRWIWEGEDPLQLSLQDLNDYMRGVSTPTHEYARVAGMYVHSLTIHPNHRDPTLIDIVRNLTASTRAYTRVILRLRAQAEKEAILAQQSRGLGITMKQPSSYYPPPSSSSSPRPGGGNHSRVSSRAPSPTTSNGAGSSSGGLTNMQETTMGGGGLTFRSPLFRLRRAPLLRVFVPSPEGDWLSDKSVLGCEEECKRAGVMHLIRLGDVIWDVAVGDEGNVGRLVWDGSYLIDLDYTYTSIGDLPKYIPALAFPPSYFHRVIRTGPVISNPIVHMDISPWGEEIAMNLQLLQDRVRTETPQGAYHNVVRWVHRSSFVIRPGPARFSTSQQQGGKTQMLVSRISIPDTDNMFVDSGWHGTVVVETEGTNEALADLQERCGPGVFPPRSRGVPSMNRIQIENKKVFRVLREKSRPGEIWIKTVGIKERIM